MRFSKLFIWVMIIVKKNKVTMKKIDKRGSVAVIIGWKYGWERLVDSFVAVSLSLQVVARLCTCF
jgi:hypothetical protein